MDTREVVPAAPEARHLRPVINLLHLLLAHSISEETATGAAIESYSAAETSQIDQQREFPSTEPLALDW
jgi:hypothetical protein